MTRVWIVVCLLAGCVTPKSAACPRDMITVEQMCVAESALDKCEGLDEGGVCDGGHCHAGACLEELARR